MSVSDLIDPIPSCNGTATLANAAGWMQGRTLYGGASALVAYTHVTRCFANLPPLRAAQVGFVAPLGPDMKLRSEIMRQGRNVTQLRTEVSCDGKVALTVFWLFGAGRDSSARHIALLPEPDAGRPEDMQRANTDSAPAFLKNNYEVLHTPDQLDAGEPVIRRWARLKDRAVLDPVAELVLMGDTLPPSALRIMAQPGPVSSINWSFNLLDTQPATRDGWWLVETASDHAEGGYSSERLRLWNADGKQMLAGIQSVAVFG